jgi:hypothetical protein
MIPNAPCPLNNQAKSAPELRSILDTKNNSTLSQISEVNVVQSCSSQKPGGKNKNKGKYKKTSNKQDNLKTVDTRPTRKPKFPCMICEEVHYTKLFPHNEASAKFLKGTFQLIQQQNMVEQNPSPPQRGNTGHSHYGDASTRTSEVYIFKEVNVTT